MIYKGAKTGQISFPLGGIGSGCIGISGSGRLVDWEIFNRPNKNSTNGFSHFAVKAEMGGRLLDARVLQGDLPPPYSGSMAYHGGRCQGFGFGPERETMAGLPNFEKMEFKGEFPIAEIKFHDGHFPGMVVMRAFNPFIPLNEKDSSIPAAFFEIEIVNSSSWRLDYSIALTARNANPAGKSINSYKKRGKFHVLKLGSDGPPSEKDCTLGDISISTDSPGTTCQEYWFRGAWFDNLGIFWRDFIAKGEIKRRRYPDVQKSPGNDHGTLVARVSVPPGSAGRARFIISWNFPIFQNYWNPGKSSCGADQCDPAASNSWRNYYSTVFEDSVDSAAYGLANWTRLFDETKQFKDALFSSSLPPEAIDAVSANISTLKSPTSVRLEDGSFYGFEGCHAGSGCCEGSCTHVWNYAYAMPFLFPALERTMRELDYKYNLRDDGGMPFRLQLPLGREKSKFRPCVDGQFGGVIKVYRDWKISGDSAWMKRLWPSVRKSIEFAWSKDNPDRWDPERSGVIGGRQHHTLDVELFGPNSWLGGFYLAALKAGAEMAQECGEHGTAKSYMETFERGRRHIEENLFNGEYYCQDVDINDRSILKPFPDADAYYWNEEHKEIKYQIGDGCGIDQVLAQWHANLCGLGEIFGSRKTRKALKAIFKHNFRRSFREFPNFCRLYALNDEAGTLMFSWPRGKRKPVVPIPYAEETMHGFEYQAASHMIMEGMINEGRELVKAVRDRYDGEKRNPWNEIECGSNYARSMASYALLNAYSGLSYDLAGGEIGFDPPKGLKLPLKFFWSLGSGWGTVAISKTRIVLRVLGGKLQIRRFKLPAHLSKRTCSHAKINGRSIGVRVEKISDLVFPGPLHIAKGDEISVS